MTNQPSAKIGVVMGQLGTPDAPTAKALRPYLKQFLSDMRVIDYSPFYGNLYYVGLFYARARVNRRGFMRAFG